MRKKRGDVRDDGLVFCQYYKSAIGEQREMWVSPERLAEIKEAGNRRKRVYRAPLSEEVKARRAAWSREYRQANKGKIPYRKEDPVKKAARARRLKEQKLAAGVCASPVQRLANNCRRRIRLALKRGKGSTIKHIGCDWLELVTHLEAQFRDGMTWENYGLRGWHVDHRVPIASATTIEELLPLLHYSNLQPLWAFENLSKHAKVL